MDNGGRFRSRCYFIFGLITRLFSVLLFHVFDRKVSAYFHMLSRGQQSYTNLGDAVILECEFYTEEFNLFDNPILWRKIQLDEETQMNMMGNLIEPYASAKRFKVAFLPRPPRYVFSLSIADVTAEDSGNYTCEINGPQNSLLGQVTHSIHIKAALSKLFLINSCEDSNSTELRQNPQVDRRHSFLSSASFPTLSPPDYDLSFVENVPSCLRCVAVRGGGGYPPPEVTVFIGRRDVTSELRMTHDNVLTGRRGLRVIVGTTSRWTDEFLARTTDDGATARCVVSVANVVTNFTEAILTVRYAPVITCFTSTAFLGDRNAQLRCEVRARPGVTSLYWILDLNGTTISKGEVISEYWTVVMDRADGTFETHLYMRQATSDNFRSYTLVAENAIGERKEQAQLMQKFRQSPGVGRAVLDEFARVGVSPRRGPGWASAGGGGGDAGDGHSAVAASAVSAEGQQEDNDNYRSGNNGVKSVTVTWLLVESMVAGLQLTFIRRHVTRTRIVSLHEYFVEL